MNAQTQFSERCNICGEKSKLTEDHVPPKFWNNKTIKYYSQGLGTNDPQKAKTPFPWQARKGIVFRSICEKCNNELLGDKTDIPLKHFIDEIKRGASKMNYSPYLNCVISVNRVARAVIGHLLAAKEFYDDKTKTDAQLREFFLNTASLPPDEMYLYFFFYPYDNIVIARDVVPVRPDKRNDPFISPDGTISCLYSYPIAFILRHGGKQKGIKMKDLFSYCSKDIDETKNVLFDYSSCYYPNTTLLRHFAWPINVTEEDDGANGLMGGISTKNLIIAKSLK